MDREDTPARASSRNTGDVSANTDANIDAATQGNTTQKRKRNNAKKRRRASASGGAGDSKSTGNSGDRQKEMEDADAAAEAEESDDEETKPKNDATDSADWGCPACTFLNDALRRFCEMCGTGNPTKPAKEAVPSEWSCVACTMKNAPALRACAVCGTINPNPPALPSMLSIARHSLHGGLFLGGGEDDEEDEDDDGDDDGMDGDGQDDSDDSPSSGDDSNSDGSNAGKRVASPCVECGVTVSADALSCPECHALRPLPRRKLKREDVSARLKKLTQRMAKHDKKHKKTKKSKDPSVSSKPPPLKNAYGVSSEVLTKLMAEPTSSKLFDTLQTLTHTLAMMDASADGEWGDMHGAAGMFVHGFGASSRSDKGKDTALLGVLGSIFRDEGSLFPVEIRLFAVQSINYLLKMDRHLFKKEDAAEAVRIFLAALKKWSVARANADNGAVRRVSKDEQMIVEECVNGLCGLCGSESAMLRELVKTTAFESFLEFLAQLAADESSALHTTTVTSSLELFQKCCSKIKWVGSGDASEKGASAEEPAKREERQVALAKRIVALLRSFLKHKMTALHVNASKCLLYLFHRMPRDEQKSQPIVSALVTADVILELVALLTTKDSEEPDDSRQAAATLLIHLLDSRREMLELVVRDKIYDPLLDGIVDLLLQPNVSNTLVTHALKLVSLLIRRVCRAPSAKPVKPRATTAIVDTTLPEHARNRLRLDSSPDPDVLATLLLDFIRADSIPAVSALLKDGADLNFPTIHDASGREIERPLVVAADVASLAMMRFLVTRGVNVHQTGPTGTALHVAAVAGRCDVVSFLLECGASPTDVDREGRSVLQRLDEVDASCGTSLSPVRKLLELHQRVLRMGEDSDVSDDGAGHAGRWMVSGGHHDDEDDFGDEDDPYYMDYDDDDDDELNSDLDDDMSSDEDEAQQELKQAAVEQQIPPSGEKEKEKKKKKRRRESVGSEKNEDKEAKRSRLAVSGQPSGDAPKAATGTDGSAPAGQSDQSDLVRATPEQISAFSDKILRSLLQTLRAVDHQNVNRAVLSTLASSLEMAPSKLVRSIPDADISLLLETVNHLLQDPAMFIKTATMPASSPKSDGTEGDASSVPTLSKASAAASQASQKSMLASYILALRILQAIVRKSLKESAVFYEIERRGICEQIERLHAHSMQAVTLPGDKAMPVRNGDRHGGIFGRGLQLLEFLRSNMVESGMLHLHRLKNMTRRLKEITEDTPVAERDMVLVDLVELFEQENSITSHEFKQSNLLEAILAFLVPPGHVDPAQRRVALLLEHFSRSPDAFRSLISRLQAVVNQDESLPLLSFFSGKGRELYPLTKQIKIVCSRLQPNANSKDPIVQKMLQLSPLTHFQSFEKTIFRCMPVKDAKLALFYFSLIGHRIHRAVDGKWKKFWVCGYDTHRGMHLLKPEDDVANELIEVVLHDAQYKLTSSVDVFEEVSLDFTLFGEPLANDTSTSNGDAKKRKRQKKKRRKSSISSSSDAVEVGVEVHNTDGTNAGQMKGAWYAGEIVDEADGNASAGSSTSDRLNFAIQAGREYTVRLLSSGKTLTKVPAESLRVRSDVPQVGSVVEVDGLLGEVTRVERKAGGEGAGDIFDVKVSRDRERKDIKKHRIRYPPSGSSSRQASSSSSSATIEAMSLSRLFPPRESSLVAGSIGERVWIPPQDKSSQDLLIAGKIHSFPSGADAVGPTAAVFVEVSFGQETAVIKVEQSRVINLAQGRGRLGSSRLLSALQTASDRSGAPSGLPLHRLLQSAAEGNDLFSNRTHSGSNSTLDHLRQLLSQSSSSSRESAWASLLSNASSDSVTAAAAAAASSASVSSDGDPEAKKPSKPKENDGPARLARVWKLVNTGEKKRHTKCTRPPKVSLQLGYERSENVDAIGFERSYEEEFGASSALYPSRKKPGDVSLTELDQATGKQVLKPKVAAVLSAVFDSFDGKAEAVRGKSGKNAKKGKKKRKLETPTAADSSTSERSGTTSWDVEKFSAFTAAAFGMSATEDPEGVLVDNCVQFSLFALPSTRRRELDLDGFLTSVLDMCKSATAARHLFSFLVSRGHSAASLLVGESKAASSSKTPAAKQADQTPASTKTLEMKSFSSDQNMLKCLAEMQQEDGVGMSSTPPWKFKYYVQCDTAVDWSAAAKSGSSLTDSSPAPVHLREITGVVSDSAMMKSVRLLSYLFETHPASLVQSSDDVWRNTRLSKKLEAQLEDVLSVCSGVYPDWCDAVVSECKFFFPRELRERLFQATSFGCTRSLHWFRNQLNMDEAAGSSAGTTANDSLANGGGIAADGIYNHEISISPIPKERVKVNRDNLLNSAEAIMKMHGKRKAILDIVFIGEKGYGSGVTAAFYSATAQALQSIAENRKEQTRCWVSGIENRQEDQEIRHPNGLFPFPHFSSTAPVKLVERFRMMGRLAGKALMDGRLFPLPLSSHFMKLVLGERVGVEELEEIFLGSGKILKSMKRVADKLHAGVDAATLQIDGMQAAEWLEATGFTFIDPLSQKPLEPRGEDKDVTLDNLKTYVDKVLRVWLDEGVRAQVEAFREGISDVLPLAKLKLLFIQELLSLLCGDADIAWDTESLLTSMKLAHGYTKESTPIKFFIESLAEMTVRERREFLLYSTGCPNLPAGGFQALRPPFEVVRRVVDTDNVDQALPFARTCTNTLHLPAYSTKQVLDERLRYAIANSAGVIDRD